MDQQSEFQEFPEYYLIGGIRHWKPFAAAARLGVSVEMLKYYRNHGRLQSHQFGFGHLYTDEQLAAADLTARKPGPKTREGSRLGRAKYTWGQDKDKGREMQDSQGSDGLMDNNRPSVASKRINESAWLPVA